MTAIVQFNWPFYIAAIFVLLAAIVGLSFLSVPALKLGCWIALSFTLYFVVVSLAVSHAVYDRSDLYRWRWLDRALQGDAIRSAVFCHTGFDEASAALRAKYPDAQWHVLDHFNEQQMTEPSIRRARALYPPAPGTIAGPYNAWPLASHSADVVFALLAIHELRTQAERAAWFAECMRCLRAGGRVIVVEHVRDVANFLAFGPGFLHFHSQQSWIESWQPAGLHCVDQFRLTPFLRVFVLRIR